MLSVLGAGCLQRTGPADGNATGTAPIEPVRLEIGDSRVEMGNGIVRLLIEKSSGRILEILYHGTDLTGTRGVGYVQSNDEKTGFLSPKKTDLIVARQDADIVDIGFRHRHRFAVDYECHYVLRSGESGFHNYVVWGYAATDGGTHRLNQLNYALRLAPALFTHYADGANRGALPTTAALAAGRKVMDATYRLADGSVYTKYNHAATMDERHRLHGLLGPRFGAWVIMPSHEFLNSVPFNTELTLHQTSKTPILLRHVQAAHYGSGIAQFSAADSAWEKWGGPWFFYFNAGGTMSEREQDATTLAGRLVEEWPFAWLNDPRFARDRGILRGRLIDQTGEPITNARVTITQAAKGEKPYDVQQQWRGYRFFGWTDEQGRFELAKVWPDQYDLFAIRDDVPGRFAKYDVEVPPSTTTDLGTMTWQTPVRGRQLWQIGTLDRSAAEFGHGDDYRQWGLWMAIAEEFPDEAIVYDVDKNNPRDLPYILAAYVKDDLSYYNPVLTIRFRLAAQPTEATAKLLFAVAEARPGRGEFANVDLRLNGNPLAAITDTFRHGGAIHRSGIRGHCQETTIPFPASRLRPGLNTLEVRLNPVVKTPRKVLGAPHIAIMFDALRLELH